jgi:hypothetical protein
MARDPHGRPQIYGGGVAPTASPSASPGILQPWSVYLCVRAFCTSFCLSLCVYLQPLMPYCKVSRLSFKGSHSALGGTGGRTTDKLTWMDLVFSACLPACLPVCLSVCLSASRLACQSVIWAVYFLFSQ